MDYIFTSICQAIGHTPVMELASIESELGLKARIVAKLELFNPGGSIKDRVALNLVQEAERAGTLQPGGTIIEPTSGNTGIGLAMVAASRGYHCIIVMPDSMSAERIKLVKAFGAEMVLTPGSEGMAGAIAKAEALRASIPGAIIAGQFDNPANPDAHENGTARELWQDTEGTLDAVVAGIGTGGTITGISRYMKHRKPSVRIIGVEPAGSPVLTGGVAGPHGLMGIGAGFVPKVLDTQAYDEVLRVTEQEAYDAARMLACREGVLVGISSGAALHGAIRLAQRPEMQGKTIVVILPDTGERYLSTPLFDSAES